MFKNHIQVAFSPEGVGGATAVASAPPKELDAVVSAIMSEPSPAAKRKQGQDDGVDGAGTATPVTDNDDTEGDDGAGDTSTDEGSDEQPGGHADDEDFDPFDSAASTADDTQEDGDDPETDAQKFTVKVDGQDEEVTLTDLMRAYSGSKAIERRLQEATETRNAVEQARVQLSQEQATLQSEVQANREAFANGLLQLKALVAQPTVKKPDPALRQTDPSRYMLALADYQADQERVNARAAQVDQALADYNSQKDEQFQQLRQAESVKLATAMPALVDPVKGPIVQKRIAMAAAKAGFTPAEISMAADHRLFLMAAAAGEYYRIMDKAKAQQDAARKGNVQTVVSAKGAQAPTAQSRNKTAMANRVNKARASGEVSDVALTLLVPKPKNRR